MISYQEILDKKSILDKIDKSIYDFRDRPLETEFQKLFYAYQSNLSKHHDYGIEPALFFFHEAERNAFSDKLDDHFIISISNGIIEFLLSKFNDNTELLNVEGLEKFKEVEKKADSPLNKLMYQLCGYYVFYHELGHLIQKSERLRIGLNKEFSIGECHLREYDADIFSALCLGTHLYEYIVTKCTDADNEECQLIIGAVTASIFVYLLSWPSARKPFYLEAESHPHPLVRIIGILFVLADYIEKLSSNKRRINLNRDAIIKSSFSVIDKIVDSILDKSEMNNFLKTFIDNKEEVIRYYHHLINLVKNTEYSAFNKRNKTAKAFSESN